MQIRSEQKQQALTELLAMLSAHHAGLRTSELINASKLFRNRRKLTAKQVFQLLVGADGVHGETVIMSANLVDWIHKRAQPISPRGGAWSGDILWKLDTVAKP
jgi:hypothetical protein